LDQKRRSSQTRFSTVLSCVDGPLDARVELR
jgi:hypothetical protein